MKLTKTNVEKYVREFDPDGIKKWTVKHEPTICSNGERGWKSDYSCDGEYVFTIIVSNSRLFSRVKAVCPA